jgi:neutral amino acid transport system permease protein
MRAVADNPDLAASSGINIERIQMTSAFLAAGISGMGGAIFGMTFRFSPETPFTLLLPSFAVIVLGTIGSIPGALIGSILIGFVRSFSHPIMTGVGQSLPGSRSNYSALPEIMPFVFLVAVLLIMPEGIGNVYDKWKVNRLRKRAEKRAKNIDIPSKKIGLILAIFFGWLGLHNFQQRKSARGESMMIITSVAYLFSKFTEFVSNNSFAKGTCNDKCLQLEKESNLDMLDRNNDGVINILDAPFTLDDVPTPPSDLAPYLHPEWSTNALESMNQSWLTLINFEIDFIQALVYLGDIVWPVIPIVVWLIALSEGYSMFYGNDKNQVNLIFQQYLNRISQKYTKLKSSISSHYSIKGPIKIIRKIIYGISQIPLLYSQYIKQFDKNMLWILFPLVLVSSSFILKASGFILLFSLIVMYSITRMSDRSIIEEYHFRTPYGKESPFGSTMLFCSLMIIILLLIIWLPVSDGPNQSNFTKTSQVSQILALISIYALWSFTLNLHTGITGMTNFGIVFFAAIGTVTVGLLTAPSHLGGYDWSVLTAVVASIILAASIGWILAYPTARLRMDYFAIVTISLGEILRVLLKSEPLLRAGTAGSSIGISGYKKPLETWWFCGKNPPINEFTGNISSPLQCRDVVGIGSFAEKLGRSDIPKLDGTGEIIVGEFVYEAAAYSMNLGQPAPYILVLAGIGIFSTAFVWILLSILLKSPWGRILRAIREDEDVAQHHGHDVLTHKAASLALGAAIAALGGVIWAWHLNGFQDSILSPAKTTFLVWAMFIIGGSGNNKGMIFGASLIWITDVIFRKLQAAQGSTSQPLWETAESIDNLFQWLVIDSFEIVKIFIFILIFGWISHRQYLIDIGISGATIFLFTGYIMVQRTIDEVYSGGQVKVTMAYVQLILVGCVLLFSLKNNPKGVLPEVPNRPHRPSKGGVK